MLIKWSDVLSQYK